MSLEDALARAADVLDDTSRATGVLKYYDSPALFATECINWPVGRGLADYQVEILDAITKHHRVCVRGPHGLGKTAQAALAILWFAITRNADNRDWKCVTTAGAWRQLEFYLWPEIKKWAKRLKWDVLGIPPLDERTQLLNLKLKLRHGEAFAAASDRPELIEGAHADSVMYIFDESKAIIPQTFDAAEGAFSGASATEGLEAYAIAMSTPGEPNGRFYDIHRRAPGLEDWWVRHVTLEEAMAAGRVASDWAEQRARQWGTESAVYHNRVLGEFHSADEDGVIPLGWVEAANERWIAWDLDGRRDSGEPHTVGVDVARSGTDKTILAVRHGNVITELRTSVREDTMATTGRVVGILNADPLSTAVVDVIGIGAGVVDRLRELNVSVEPFNASSGTRRRDASNELGFRNVRTAGWWNLRELLDPARGADVALPPDDELMGDLTAPHVKPISGGKLQVESKDEIRKRIGRSTDRGDAVMQAFFVSGASWASAYGITECDHCKRSFMEEIEGVTRTACPFCSRAIESVQEPDAEAKASA